MYCAHWNIKDTPFLCTYDARYLYTAGPYEEAIARFSFLAESGRLAGLLAGPCGVGKSTVLKRVAEKLGAGQKPVIRVDAVPDGHLALMRHLGRQLSIDLSAPGLTLPDALFTFARQIEGQRDRLKRSVLLLDDAHHLLDGHGSHLFSYLADLRIPGSRTQPEQPLFTLILAGDAALLDGLKANASLAQHMQIVYRLEPLSAAESSAYVQHHMRAVGGDLWVFDHDALAALHAFARGIPRCINLLCDTALMLGFAAKANRIDPTIIRQAAAETGLAAWQPAHPEGGKHA